MLLFHLYTAWICDCNEEKLHEKVQQSITHTFKVLWGDHSDEVECPVISEHLIRPLANTTHAFNGCDAIVGDENLWEREVEGVRNGG